MGYFNSAGNYFCIMGKWDADMDCDPSVLEPYPQFYAYALFASPNYLNLQAGGHMAASVSPSSTTSGLSATAFYTNTADNVVVINPTSTAYNAVTIDLTNPGLASPIGEVYLIDASHGQISSQSANIKSISRGYSAVVEVPPYSTVALSVRNGLAGAAASVVLSVTPQSGTHPLAVNIDSSASQRGGSAIIGRTIDFGDGTWLNWTQSTSHIYSKAGTYTIRLSLRDQAGQLSTTSTSITVH
jgi:PKD repeat protein